MATLKSVLLAFLLIFLGAVLVGILAGGPPSNGIVVVGGMFVAGAIAINVAARVQDAAPTKVLAWTAGPIVVLYGSLLLPEWWTSGRVYGASLFTSGAVIVGLIVGWLWLLLRNGPRSNA